MSPLISIQALSKSFGTQTLFENLSFTISKGDRIGLVGPNGAGKSTLLKILMNLEDEDSGTIIRRGGLHLGYSSQSPEFPDVPLETLLGSHDEEKLLQARILLAKAEFSNYTQSAQKLSGGWKKRLDITRAFMDEPDLLLLDEPTNHLDLEGILWLEKRLLREDLSYLVISHDRTFLENVCNKVIELNRCFPQNLFISQGAMSEYIEKRIAFLENQAQREKSLFSKLEKEEEWLKKSPKARTTKSRSRIQDAYELKDEHAAIRKRNTSYKVDISFSSSERQTRKLLSAKNLMKKMGDTTLFQGIDLVLSPGSRLGIVGKNGTGKTTLMKVLAGMIPQDLGTIKTVDNLKIVYFDQHREQLSPHISLKEALSPNGEFVVWQGLPIHVNGWAKKFLFQPDRLELPIGCLSGGERARIQIAKILLEPADILFLDEPTNDLDIATLEVIEESLQEFFGAVVLISHDRCFMDRLATQILGLGEDLEQHFFADYLQWIQATSSSSKKEEVVKEQKAPVQKQQKLSYKEQKELDEMEKKILEAEQEIASLEEKVHTQDLSVEESMKLYQTLNEAHEKHNNFFERWQHLENKKNQLLQL